MDRKRELQPVKCRKWFVLNTFVFFLNISNVHEDRRGGGPRQERATQNGLVSFSLVNSEVDGVISEEIDRRADFGEKGEKKQKKKEPPFSAIMRFSDLNGGFWS